MSTTERWTVVKNLYSALLPLDPEQRKKYLDQNCPDPEVRKEIERLLLSESTATNVSAVVPLSPPADSLVPGTILGHYKIQKRIGAGGMGLVYEALDEKLQRNVAIKIIQSQAAGPEDRARFLREAQSVSALNHPNIVTVFEAGHEDGLDFIAMELVQGETLRQKIGPKGIELRKALRYAVQIADALSAAHEAGIVHRDLKPGNVMVTDRDLVKVLDFGLAKRQGREGEYEESLTGKGHVVGTAAYMSPEQAQGRPVDSRSDIFSFGSVLYEMLTGLRAFQEDSHVGTMAAILHRDPLPLRDVTQGVPSGIARIITKCLQKKPHDRWQDMQDLKLVLSGLLEDLEGAPSGVLPGAATVVPPVPSAPTPRRRWLLPAVVAGGLVAGALAMYVWIGARPAEPVNEPVYRTVTADNGLNDYPALSRDGKFIAFASDRAGGDNLDLWLQQIGGREMIQLTKDQTDATDPAFSPDGTHIAYRSERNGGGIYVVQALGGDPILLVRGGRNPRYSPDGKWIAYWTGRSGESYVTGSSKVFIIEAGGGQPRQVHPEMSVAQFPIWSPGGEALLVYGIKDPAPQNPAVLENAYAQLDYWVLPVEGNAPPRKTMVAQGIASLEFPSVSRPRFKRPDRAPLDWNGARGGRLMLPFTVGDSANLWEAVLDNQSRIIGLPRRITRGPGRQVHGSKAVMDAFERLAFSDVEENYDVWSASVDPARASDPASAKRLTNSIATEWTPSVSKDGRTLLFIGRRSGSWAVVLHDVETGRERILASSSLLLKAAISGDGSKVVYTDTSLDLMSMSASGGEVEKLTGPRGTVLALSFDGRYVAYEPVSDEDVMVFDTVQKRTLTLAPRPDPNFILTGTRFSADGKWVAFHSIQYPLRNTRIWIAPLNVGQPVPPQSWIPVTDESTLSQDPCWAADGLTIYFSSERDGFRCFWGQRLDPATKQPKGEPFAVRHFHSARHTLRGMELRGIYTGLSEAAGRLFYSIVETKGNIWLEERKLGQ